MDTTTGNLGDNPPFHHGEQSVQERLGVRDIEEWARKVVHAHLPEQHREFHTSQPFLVVSARDAADTFFIASGLPVYRFCDR